MGHEMGAAEERGEVAASLTSTRNTLFICTPGMDQAPRARQQGISQRNVTRAEPRTEHPAPARSSRKRFSPRSEL